MSNATEIDSLPALSPDLVAAEGVGGWRVQRVSPRLAAGAGAPAEAFRGRDLESLFAGSIPSFSDLASEAVAGERELSDIRIRLGDGPLFSAHVIPGGLAEDFSGRIVFFHLAEVAPAVASAGVSFEQMVGSSPAIREVFRKISLYAPSDAAVVITGETGTGKELVARALHSVSLRSRGPFVALNCTAITDELLESELFGHEKGAFTGAVRTHRGRFERADGGTLFLDEIGDMPPRAQAKLLRVLEEGRIERVGAEKEQKVDVRVVAATNVPLERAVGEGGFRADLYHRLSVLRIHIPPLRQRAEDIPLLAEHFLESFNEKYGKSIRRYSPESLHLLQSYLWPGNIRELRNVLERVFVETEAEVIGAGAFREWVRERQNFAPGDWDLETGESRRKSPMAPPYPLPSQQHLLEAPSRQTFEAELLPPAPAGPSTVPVELDAEEISSAYEAAGGNLSAAARLLGVHRATLYRYMKKLGLSREDL